MFYYISGTLVLKTENYAVVDANGIGYKVFASARTLKELGECGKTVKLFTYVNFKASADIFDIYGFISAEELKTFELIIGVSRVGAKTAISLLSGITPSKFALCVLTNDSAYIAKHTPGLGAKGAQRIVLELKDKFKNVDINSAAANDINENVSGSGSEKDEAVAALMVLGYTRQEAIASLGGASGTVEEMVKYGLKNLMKG